MQNLKQSEQLLKYLNSSAFHKIIEGDARTIVFGTIGYTVFVNAKGEPQIKTLKVNKARRKKYGK